MNPINDGGPVSPTLPEHGFNSGEPGMTLRDHFAGIALPTLMKRAYELEEECCGEPDFKTLLRIHTKEAYTWADAMIEAKTR